MTFFWIVFSLMCRALVTMVFKNLLFAGKRSINMAKQHWSPVQLVSLEVILWSICLSATQAILLVKKGLLAVGQIPQNFGELIPFFWKTFTNAYVISAVLLTIVAALTWILAVSRAQLSFIYPFMALTYLLVALFSLLIFKENLTILRWLGIIVICLGVFLVSRS